MPYTHLSPFERVEIQSMRTRMSIRKIAEALGRSPSTISRELRRNGLHRGRYRALNAQYAYRERRKRSVRRRILETKGRVHRYVTQKLSADFSPEQIAGTLRRDYPRDHTMRVSHETIYTFVYAEKRNGGSLFQHLRQAHRRRRRRGNRNGRRGLFPGRVGIETRPKIVDKRKRTGDWEADLVLGRQRGPAILTLVERKHGYTIARKVANRRAHTVGRAIIEAFRKIPRRFIKTITFDNGKEFAHFRELEAALDTNTYFAHPYAAWERGTNENTNGLLRQYIPKGADLNSLTQNHLNTIIHKLNNRPRKRLNYRTPEQTFLKAIVALHF